MDAFVMLCHGLAYFGVWLLNVIIYETAAVIIWFAVAMGTGLSSRIPENVSDEITRITAIILLILLAVASIACAIGWFRIVPMPVFG